MAFTVEPFAWLAASLAKQTSGALTALPVRTTDHPELLRVTVPM
jgi:hypothetical protein